MRMPAAWNARAALKLSSRPQLLVADLLGNGPPDSQHVDAVYPSASLFGCCFAPSHGYHVVGIAAGNFDDDGTPAGLVTGVFPAQTLLLPVDVSEKTLDETILLILLRASVNPGHIVVNTSLGYHQSPDVSKGLTDGSDWASEVRRRGLEGRVFQATAAGNETTNGTNESPWSAAALRSDLVDPNTGQHIPPLANTLVVESVADTGSPAFDPGCLSSFSNTGGTIAAVGEDVYSTLNYGGAGNLSGTSMASPQIAALGEYLWSIAPDLTAPQIAAAIRATARPGACQDAPQADAYAAVLSLDQTTTPAPASAPVRLAILDVDNNGRFDESDVQTLANAIIKPAIDRDWSRYDLNGDGFTGGSKTAAFDLDPTGSTRAGAPNLSTVMQTINGPQVSYHEHAVTDKDILCYYAYSSLYTGSTSQRDSILGGPCSPPIVFDSTRSGTQAVWSINPDGTGARLLASPANINGPPSLSADGSQIVFSSQTAILTTMSVDGSGQRSLAGAGRGNSPSWSPDDKQIVFSHIQPGSPPDDRVAVVNVDGSGLHELTSDPTSDSFPVFSPDGTKIAYGFQGDIWVVNADGSNQHDITNDPGNNYENEPDWSPDGSQIVYSRTANGQQQLALMNSDGSGQHAAHNPRGHPPRLLT
jgi:hypothetical protein